MSPDAIRVLLDPAAFARAASEVPALRGKRLGEARLAAYWVKPGRYFNACFEIDGDDERFVVSGFALTAGRADALSGRLGGHRCASGDPKACAPCATLRTAAGLVLQLFPFDERLRTLPHCLDARRVGEALGGAIVACEPSGYRPGMRCQIRYRFADGSVAYGKVAVERDPGRAFRLQEKLFAAFGAAASGVRVARPWRYLSDLRLTVVCGAPGRNLHELLSPHSPPPAALAAVARGLGELHGLTADGIDRLYTPAEEVALVASWAGLIGEIFPHHREALGACLGRLRETVPAPAARPVLVHRDFYAKQILLSSRGLALLDLDTVCWGDPEIDLGNFAAHLVLRALQAGVPAWAERAEELFLSAYPGSVLGERLGWYRTATLLRLACVYVLRPQWRSLASSLIAAAGGGAGVGPNRGSADEGGRAPNGGVA